MNRIKLQPKVTAIIVILLIIILSGIGYAIYKTNTPQKINTQNFQEPTAIQIELPSAVVVNNIYKNEGHTYESGTKVFEKNQYYQITYSPTEDLFDIVILSSDFNEGRLLAENAFIRELGIAKEEACELNVKMYTHPQLNPAEADNEYGLSFCE